MMVHLNTKKQLENMRTFGNEILILFYMVIYCHRTFMYYQYCHMSENKKQSFDEYWAEEEKILKMSYEMSKRWRAEGLNKSPAKKLIDRIEGRVKDEESDDKTRT